MHAITTYTRPSTQLTQRTIVSAIQDYIDHCARSYDILADIDTDDIAIDISTQMKRAAGKAIYDKRTGEKTIRIAWGAYDSWGWGDDIEGVIRHELAHIVEYHVRGEGGHGLHFMLYADKLDAPHKCRQFTDFTYELFCDDCDGFVTGRYQRSKVVTQPKSYRSKCCSSPLHLG
jgi:predicted SprT family Zn-dependent metalloprotease